MAILIAVLAACGSGNDEISVIMDEYTFEIESLVTGPQASGARFVEAREVVVRCGAPVEAKDFKLSFERCRRRIDYVATTGLPWRLSGW